MGSLTMEDLIRGIEKKFVRSNGYMSKEWDTPVFFEGLFTEGVKEEAQKPVSEIMSPVKESVGPGGIHYQGHLYHDGKKPDHPAGD